MYVLAIILSVASTKSACVVCLDVVWLLHTLRPSSWFTSVVFPALGRPKTAALSNLCSLSPSEITPGRAADEVLRGVESVGEVLEQQRSLPVARKDVENSSIISLCVPRLPFTPRGF